MQSRKELKRQISELEDRIQELSIENYNMKERLKAERMTFVIAVPYYGLQYANTKDAKEYLKSEAMTQLAHKIGQSGFFREKDKNGFIELEVTLVK